MKLILMRHADASWDSDGGDHARRLSDGGQKAAAALGYWLRAKGHIPDHALVSDAARTRETFDRLKLTCPITFHADLYLAEPAQILKHLGAIQTGNTILMIGHNPGIAEVAHGITVTPPDHPGFWTFPSGAALVLDLADRQVIDFITPGDLASSP
ncbi:MAG: SixA phosphatase family protein [Planktomarina sp.]